MRRQPALPEALVLTPGGFRPASRAHRIEAEHHLDLAGGRLRKVHRSGRTVADFGPLEHAATPPPSRPGNVARGAPAPRSAIEAVPGLGGGWIAYAGWTNTSGAPVSLLRTTWTVPPPPRTQSGQTVFLFNGIENATMIYQPVLQWGVSAAGGGDYWAIASWYAAGPGGHSFYSPLTPVAAGTELVGVMTLTDRSSTGCSYEAAFEGFAATSLPVRNVPELSWCVQTLEAYGIGARSDYPPVTVTAMRAIELQVGGRPAALAWTAYSPVTDTGQHCVVVSNDAALGEVDLYYQQPAATPVA